MKRPADLGSLANLPDWGTLLVDQRLRHRDFESTVARLFGVHCRAALAGYPGHATGCINAVVEGMPCLETSRCRHCPLYQALVRTLAEGVTVGPAVLQRTFWIDGRRSEEMFDFISRPLRVEGERKVMVTLCRRAHAP